MIVWAARLLGRPLPERVAGIDLMHALLDLSRGEGFRVYLLGARAEVLARAEAEICDLYPGIEIAGRHHGYFGAEGEDEVVESIAAATPDLLFVALETPAKELFLARHRERMRAAVRDGRRRLVRRPRGREAPRAAVDAQRRPRMVLPPDPGAAAHGRPLRGRKHAVPPARAPGASRRAAADALAGPGEDLVAGRGPQVVAAHEPASSTVAASGVFCDSTTNAGRGSASSEAATFAITRCITGSRNGL